jgi:hypothetical protein
VELLEKLGLVNVTRSYRDLVACIKDLLWKNIQHVDDFTADAILKDDDSQIGNV